MGLICLKAKYDMATKIYKLSEILEFSKKSHRKAGDGLSEGKYPFFTSSQVQGKWLNEADYKEESIILGTGGLPSIHFAKDFSTSADTFIIKTINKSISLKYVYFFLYGNKDLLGRGFKGAGLKHLSKQYVEKMLIPVPVDNEGNPDLLEQNTIVSLIEETEVLRKKRQDVAEKMFSLVESIFMKKFGDPNKNKMGWELKRLDSISNICSGVTKGRKLDKAKIISVPYMRVANVQDGYIDLTEIKLIDVLQSDLEKYRLIKGDLLLTEGGDPDKLGRGGIWGGQVDDCIHQNHIFRLRLDQEVVTPEYISVLVASSYGKRYFLKSAKQTSGIATINSTQLKKFPVLVPPIQLQKEFALLVKEIESQKNKQKESTQKFEELFSAVMSKSFT
jgi:type I restriction enzyme S subunit